MLKRDDFLNRLEAAEKRDNKLASEESDDHEARIRNINIGVNTIMESDIYDNY